MRDGGAFNYALLFLHLFSENALGQGGLAVAEHGVVDLPQLLVPVGGGAAVDAAVEPGAGGEPCITELCRKLLVQAEGQGTMF